MHGRPGYYYMVTVFSDAGNRRLRSVCTLWKHVPVRWSRRDGLQPLANTNLFNETLENFLADVAKLRGLVGRAGYPVRSLEMNPCNVFIR